MKKTIISLAVTAGMAASTAVLAEATVYGNAHVSLNQLGDVIYDDGDVVATDKMFMSSNTSDIGVKGSEDLGNGLKALYKMEWQVDVANRNGTASCIMCDNSKESTAALTDRDQWVGLKGGMGTVKFGTMSNNYKQMGGKVDPFYRTLAEGRGLLNMQSGYHGGAGEDGGRSTNTVQYSSPKMGGMQLVINRTFTGADGSQDDGFGNDISNDETLGLGFRYEAKGIVAYFDYLDPNEGGEGGFTNNTYNGGDESMMKVGGKFSTSQFSVGGQYEMSEDQTGGDYIMLSGTFNIDKNNVVALTYGQQDDVSNALAIGYVHVLGKGTNVYAAYGKVDADKCEGTGFGSECSYDLGQSNDSGQASDGNSLVSFGIRKKF